MSQVQSIGSETQVRAAIARAASASGVDFDYLLAQAKIESNLNPNARSGNSSATGLYQFTNSTWLSTLAKHGGDYGLSWAADPAMRQQAMALRFDPQVSAMMAAGLANDNKATLTTSLGHSPDASELYLAHFLGSDGATRLLNGLASNPAQPAAALVPAAAASNRAIFYQPDGAPRSVSEVMGLVRGKLANALEGTDASQWALADGADPSGDYAAMPYLQPATGGPIAREFHAAAQAQQAQTAQRPSMAQVLAQTFAMGAPSAAAMPDHVRAAYAQLAALGL